MKIRIAYKIGLLASILVAVAAGIVGVTAHRISSGLLKDHEIVDLADETNLRGKELLGHFSAVREDVLTLAGSPTLQAIIRARQSPPAENAEA
ncbi:MAG: hypothetical protein JNG89_20425, partial [Planctomycetaceae bacterium]|nr:hypothetical protein [Planctomycetaceae bacterium]